MIMNFSKTAQNLVELSFDVPESEKLQVKSAVKQLIFVGNSLELFNDYLDLINIPFSNHETVSKESVYKNRGFIIRYKNNISKKFRKDIGVPSIKCLNLLEKFAVDSYVADLLSGFSDNVEKLNNSVKTFLDVLEDYESKEFRAAVIASVANIKKNSIQLEKYIYDRIITHINANILATSWTDGFSKDLDLQIKKI